MQSFISDYPMTKNYFDQDQTYLEPINKKSKLDAISGFFKKWSHNKSSPFEIQSGRQVSHDESNGDTWLNDDDDDDDDDIKYFLPPPQTIPTSIVNLHDFNFSAMTLERAFRNFYKIVDINIKHSLLHDFSRRYFECNPRCIFGTTRVIHQIVCALVFLNSSKKKISETAFIRSTMNGIYQHLGTSSSATSKTTKTHRLNAEHLNWLFYNGSTAVHDTEFMPHDLSALIFGSLAWQSEIKAILKNMYISIKKKPLKTEDSHTGLDFINTASMYHTYSSSNSVSSVPSSSSSSSSSRSLSSSSSSTSDNDDDDNETVISRSNFVSGLKVDLPTRYLKNAPYYKDGLLCCKRVLQDNKIVKQNWKTCFVMTEQDQVYLFPTQTTEATADNDNHNKEIIDLKNSMTSILPFGYNRKRPYCFSIKLADGSAYILEAKSIHDVKQWISTCNYWAARTSYPTSSSTPHGHLLDEGAQLEMHQKYINTLYCALEKKKKSTSLLREMMKYQTYCNSIESSLAFQIKIMSF